MARRGSKKRSREDTTASLELPLLIASPIVPSWNPVTLEDRRAHHPLRMHRPAASRLHSDRRIVEVVRRPTKRNRSHHYARPHYAVPEQVSICVRRKQRREIMHALKHAGKGGMRKPRRTLLSRIKC